MLRRTAVLGHFTARVRDHTTSPPFRFLKCSIERREGMQLLPGLEGLLRCLRSAGPTARQPRSHSSWILWNADQMQEVGDRDNRNPGRCLFREDGMADGKIVFPKHPRFESVGRLSTPDRKSFL